MKATILILIACASGFAAAEVRDFTMMEYFVTEVQPEDVVCEVLSLEPPASRCFVTLAFDKTATPFKGKIRKVRVKQVLAEQEGTAIKQADTVDVVLKVDWKDDGVPEEHIVQGQIVTDESGKSSFKITNVPDLFPIGIMTGPTEEQKHAQKWLEKIINSVMPRVPTLP